MFLAEVTKTIKTLNGIEIAEEPPKGWADKIDGQNYQISCKSFQFQIFLNHQKVAVKSLNIHTLKLALNNT